MTNSTRFTSFAILTFFATSAIAAQAATLQINSIAPFDINLGTLTHVTVSLDPAAIQTDSYTTDFDSISSHTHTAYTPPVNISGFDTFNFAPTPTSPSSSNAFSSHSHILNLSASVNNYSGSSLTWFLNQANTPINGVAIPSFFTTTTQDHKHLIHLSPIIPRTTFTFIPVPEPTTLTLLAVAGLAFVLRRR